jgi:hypothetical protein
VRGVVVQDVRRGELAQLSEIHDGDPVAHMLHNCEVVRDEEHGQAHPGLQILQKIEDLCLYRHVECGDRFVAYEELRLEHEGPGDAHPLTLTTRELDRAAPPCRIRIDADSLEHLFDLLHPLGASPNLPDRQRFGDDVAYLAARVQRRDGVLEYELDLRPELAEVPATERGELRTVETDAP